VFSLGEAFTANKKIQAVGVRFAAATEIVTALTSAGTEALKAGV